MEGLQSTSIVIIIIDLSTPSWIIEAWVVAIPGSLIPAIRAAKASSSPIAIEYFAVPLSSSFLHLSLPNPNSFCSASAVHGGAVAHFHIADAPGASRRPVVGVLFDAEPLHNTSELLFKGGGIAAVLFLRFFL